MASWEDFIIPDGEAKFEQKAAFDHIPHRRKTVAQGVEKQIANLDDPETAKRAWFTIKDDIAKLTVRLGARPIPFHQGKTEVYVPVKHAKAAYKAIGEEVLQGKLDGAIATLFDPGADENGVPRKIDGRSTRGGLSDDAKALRRQKMAERKAKEAQTHG